MVFRNMCSPPQVISPTPPALWSASLYCAVHPQTSRKVLFRSPFVLSGQNSNRTVNGVVEQTGWKADDSGHLQPARLAVVPSSHWQCREGNLVFDFAQLRPQILHSWPRPCEIQLSVGWNCCRLRPTAASWQKLLPGVTVFVVLWTNPPFFGTRFWRCGENMGVLWEDDTHLAGACGWLPLHPRINLTLFAEI